MPVRNPEFSSYMQRIKDAKPDSVFVFMPIGDLVPQFLKAYADSGLKNSPIRLLGTGDMADESVVDAAGDAAVGLITTGVYATAHDSALNRQLVADFAAQFGKSPRLSLGQIAVWDAVHKGLVTAGATNGTVQTQLEAVDERIAARQTTIGGILIDVQQSSEQDLARAATALTQAQQAVQASSQVFITLKNVSLLNFLQ